MRRQAALTFFVLAFVITWAVWLPRAMGQEWAVELGAVWSYGPAMAAVAAAALIGGRGGLRRLGARLTDWRVGARWYLVIFLLPVALALVEAGITTILDGGSWSDHLPAVLTGPSAGLLLLLVALVLTDGLGEELGWRGYALPHMLERSSAVTASLMLGVVWAAWHLPLFWTDGSALEGTSIWLLVARLPATAVIYTWLFQHTRGSVVPAILLHGTLNFFSVPPPAVGESLTPGLVSLGMHWVLAGTLVFFAGARALDRWPGPARPAQVATPAT